MIPTEVDPASARILERYGFEAIPFDDLRRRVASGELSAASNVVAEPVEPPLPDDLLPFPEPSTRSWADAHRAGVDALRAGEVAAVVLGGGMATRFGGVVKGVLEAVDGRSFLEIKLSEIERVRTGLEAQIPVAVMTSFATDDVTRAFVTERGLPEPVFFSQFVSLRLAPDGTLFRGSDGRVSLYGPGHGDLFEALRWGGVLAGLRDQGVRILTVSNVDNLGARIDPVVIGAHLLAGRPLTAEVARKEGDMGGAPVRVGGTLRLLEGPCFPPSFDQDLTPVFNTNTALVSLDAVDRELDLTWLYVAKEVDGMRAVQLERVYHEVTRLLDTTYLVVPRTGPRGRFFPIKTPDDLARSQEALREMLAASTLD